MAQPNLDLPLMDMSIGDAFSLRDSQTHTLILGGTGSGKTSGPGKAIARSFLRAGMGGCVTIAKAEDVDMWVSLLGETNRMASAIEFSPTQNCFNFIAYELSRLGVDGINSVVECIMRVLEAARNAGASPGRTGDAFWESATRQILRNALPIIYAAKGTISITDIVQFVRSAPRSRDDMRDPQWAAGSFFYATFAAAVGKVSDEVGRQASSFWRDEFAALDQKTQGNVAISLTTTLDRFNFGWLKRAFTGQSTITPELSFGGVVFFLNMPALTLGDDAVMAQVIFKYMWERAVLARNSLAPNQRSRPVFLFSDEAQMFVNSYDAEFLATCRSSLCSVVFLSQSLPTFYAKVGGEGARERTHHLLGNFATKVFCSNGCPETNEWAAKTLGRRLVRRHTYGENSGSNESWNTSWGMSMSDGTSSQSGSSSGSSYSNGNSSSTHGSNSSTGTSHTFGDNRGGQNGGGRSSGTNYGENEAMDYIIEPGEFGSLLSTGGPAHRNIVSAIWYQAGRTFGETGANFLFARFQQ